MRFPAGTPSPQTAWDELRAELAKSIERNDVLIGKCQQLAETLVNVLKLRKGFEYTTPEEQAVIRGAKALLEECR